MRPRDQLGHYRAGAASQGRVAGYRRPPLVSGCLAPGSGGRSPYRRRAGRTQHPLIFDYEHQILHAEDNGQPAPRAATYRVEYRPGQGLMAVDIVWTKRARQYLWGGEYGYISSVFSYDSHTGEVSSYFHDALTNTPALDLAEEARAAAKFQPDNPQPEDATMNKQILELLGLDKNDTEEQINQGVAAFKRRALTDATLKALAVDADADKVNQAVASLATKVGEKDEQIAARKSGEPDPSQYAPVSVVEELKSQVNELSQRVTDNNVDELVSAALFDGRLLKAQE